MQVSQRMQMIGFSTLLFFIYSSVNTQAHAENVVENGREVGEDDSEFHDKMSHERRHLLAHLADRMDLDGEGLRHIQKHLDEQTLNAEESKDLKDVADGDNSKGIFYFFKFHDYDNNQKLDGLEWMQALTDFHQEDDENKGEFKEGGKVFLEHEAEAIIDELLSKHDKNDDGMIDFFELMNSKVESLMTDLDKPQPGESEDHTGEEHTQNAEEQSSLEQEFNQLQQKNEQTNDQGSQEDQQHNEHQQNDEQQVQDNQQQEENNEQEQNSEKNVENQETNDQEQKQNEPSSLEEEYNRQQQQP